MQTRGGCSPAREPSGTAFPAWPGAERSHPAAQRLERKREAAAGPEISPEAVMSAGTPTDGARGSVAWAPLLPAHNPTAHSRAPSVKHAPAGGRCDPTSPGSPALHLLSAWVGLWAGLGPTTHNPEASRDPPQQPGLAQSLAFSRHGEVQQLSKPNSLQLPPPHSSTKPSQGLSSLPCPGEPSGLSPNPTFPAVQHDICPLGTSPEHPSPCPGPERCSHHHRTRPPAPSSMGRAEGRAKAGPGCSEG